MFISELFALLANEHFLGHPVYIHLSNNQYEYLHWVLVRERVEIEGNEFRRSKTFTKLRL